MVANAKKTILSFKLKNGNELYVLELMDKVSIEYKMVSNGWFNPKEKKYLDKKTESSLDMMEEYLNDIKDYSLLKIKDKIVIWKDVNKDTVTITQEDTKVEVDESPYYEFYG